MAYDVFISFKNTEPTGGLTLDRAIAERIHSKLRDEGLEVFFSERDLDTAAFMNQIYGALEEAQLLVLVGTSLEHIKSQWVMSEWRNFLGAMNSGKKPNGQMITVLSGISTNDLPIEISNMQSFHANDLDGICKFVFRALGKFTNTEVRERIAQEEERKRKEAEEAALREMRLRMEAEAAAERERLEREREQLAQEKAKLEQARRLKEAEEAAQKEREQREREAIERKEAEELAKQERIRREQLEKDVVDTRAVYAERRKRLAIIAAAACAALVLTVAITAFFIWKNSFIYVDGEKVDKGTAEIVLDGRDVDNLSALKNYKQLKTLQLTNVELTDEELWYAFTSLPECSVSCTVDMFGRSVDSNTDTIDLSGNSNVVLDQLADKMRFFSKAKKVDLTGCDVQDSDVSRFMSEFPNLNVVWDIDLFGSTFTSASEEIDLSGNTSVTLEELSQKLGFFSKLSLVDLSGCGLDNESLQAFGAGHPGIDVIWDIKLFGRTFSSDETSISLVDARIDSADELIASLKYFGDLRQLDIRNCGLDNKSVASVINAYPNVSVNWTVSLFGNEYASGITELHLGDTDFGTLDDLRANLHYFKSLRSIDFSGSKFDNETLYEFKQSLDGIDVYWTINFYGESYKTNITSLSLRSVSITDISDLKYFTDLRDLYLSYGVVNGMYTYGCRGGIVDISPLSNLKELRRLSLWGNRISDISPLAGLTNLEKLWIDHNNISDISALSNLKNLRILTMLENRITDITPLAELTKLEKLLLSTNSISDVSALSNLKSLTYLNLSKNRISDATPLAGLKKLDVLYLCSNGVSSQSKETLKSSLPNCDIIYYASSETLVNNELQIFE